MDQSVNNIDEIPEWFRMAWIWGQFADHDIDLTPPVLEQDKTREPSVSPTKHN